MRNEMNAALSRAGYTALSQMQWDELLRVLGDEFRLWVFAYLEAGASSSHWPKLRASLLAMSADLNDALRKSGVCITSSALIKGLVESPDLTRSAMLVLRGQMRPAEFARCAVSAPVTVDQGRIHKIYGGQCALTFEAAKTRAGVSCLQVEAARKSPGGYDWRKKISLQLSEQEALSVYSVFHGWLSIFEATNHGADRNKYLTVRRQEASPGWVVSVRQLSDARVCPIPPMAAYKIIGLAGRVLLENAPHMTLDQIKDTAQRLAAG